MSRLSTLAPLSPSINGREYVHQLMHSTPECEEQTESEPDDSQQFAGIEDFVKLPTTKRAGDNTYRNVKADPDKLATGWQSAHQARSHDPLVMSVTIS